jgi:pimeloyl-ACP methyl ester carboxylesterase
VTAATPTTCYASGPRGALAYQVTGTGPVDLLMVPGMHSHLELQWQLPGYRRFVRGLTRHCRLIRYDKLGTGLSDPTSSTPTADERVDDLTAVAAACGATTPVVLGFSEGGPLAIRFATSHQVAGLVLYGTSVRPPTSEARAELDLVLQGWGSGRSLDTFAPSLAADPAARRITAFLERAAASPAMIRHVIAALADSSAQGLLERLPFPPTTPRCWPSSSFRSRPGVAAGVSRTFGPASSAAQAWRPLRGRAGWSASATCPPTSANRPEPLGPGR